MVTKSWCSHMDYRINQQPDEIPQLTSVASQPSEHTKQPENKVTAPKGSAHSPTAIKAKILPLLSIQVHFHCTRAVQEQRLTF